MRGALRTVSSDEAQRHRQSLQRVSSDVPMRPWRKVKVTEFDVPPTRHFRPNASPPSMLAAGTVHEHGRRQPNRGRFRRRHGQPPRPGQRRKCAGASSATTPCTAPVRKRCAHPRAAIASSTSTPAKKARQLASLTSMEIPRSAFLRGQCLDRRISSRDFILEARIIAQPNGNLVFDQRANDSCAAPASNPAPCSRRASKAFRHKLQSRLWRSPSNLPTRKPLSRIRYGS